MDGAPGPFGSDAPASPDGQVTFAVLDPESGAVIESAAMPFNVCLGGFVIAGENNDCIFEPGETITISQVSVTNNGGLCLPAGAVITFNTSPTVTFNPEACTIVLPAIPAGASYVCPENIFGRIYDITVPVTPGTYVGQALFDTSVTLLNRPFLDGVVAADIPIQYPARFQEITSPSQMGFAETQKITIPLTNLSTMDIMGLLVKVEVGQFIVPTSVAPSSPGVVTFPLPQFAARQTINLTLDVQLSPNSELFEKYPFRVSIEYKGDVVLLIRFSLPHFFFLLRQDD